MGCGPSTSRLLRTGLHRQQSQWDAVLAGVHVAVAQRPLRNRAREGDLHTLRAGIRMIWIEVAPPSNSTRKMSTWSLCAATGIGVPAAAGSSGSMVKPSASIAIRTQAPTPVASDVDAL